MIRSNPNIEFSASDKGASPQPTIFIVDDDERTLRSLRWLVETLDVPVKTYPSAELFLTEYDGQLPGCLIADIRMSGMGGLDLQRELRCLGHEIPVIVLTGHASVPVVVEALKQGATEFLEKPVDDEMLLQAVQRSLTLDEQRRSEGNKHREVWQRMERLTAREREVLRYVVSGLSSKEIATRLSVSSKTIEAHRAKIMGKMEAASVAELVRAVVSADPSLTSALGHDD